VGDRARHLEQLGPRLRRRRQQIAPVVQQPNVQIPWDLKEPTVDAGKLGGPGQEIRSLLVGEEIVERQQPCCLGGRVFRMRRNQVERVAVLERAPDERIQLGMRQLRHDLDANAGLGFERRQDRVKRVVHRPANERGAQYRSRCVAHAATFPHSSRRRS
jgi:hypothetical protein